MNRIITVILLSTSIIFIIVIFGSTFNMKSVSYIESSYGLQSIDWESGRSEIKIADINKDGHNDFLSIGDHGNPLVNSDEQGLMIWFGNGTGTNWSHFQIGDFGYGGIAIGDVNNDDKYDVGYGMHHNYSGVDFGDQILEVALGNGTGHNWTPWDDSLAMNGETWGMFSCDFGDVDNNGILDLGAISFGCCNGVRVYKNFNNGVWRQLWGVNGGNSSMSFCFGDINNDGNLDIAAGHQYGTVYFGDGNSNFALKQLNLPSPGTSGYAYVDLSDIDNDGSDEFAFVTSQGALNVWKWNIVNAQWDNRSNNLPTSSGARGIKLADMNNDGFQDIVAVGGGSCNVWAGNGGTNWIQMASIAIPSPGTYTAMDLKDMDHNGYCDIMMINKEGGTWNSVNILRFFKETTPYTTLSVTPLYPRGWENLKNNSVRIIEWISAAPQGQPALVKLEFSSSGYNGPWSLIKDSLPNNGSHQWVTPQNINSGNCFIKFTLFVPGTMQSVSSMNSSPFAIGGIASVPVNNEPRVFSIYNYPNPFNSSTTLRIELSELSEIRIELFDLNGKNVYDTGNKIHTPGVYNKTIDLSNSSTGIYLCKVSSGLLSRIIKLVYLK